MKKVLIMRGVPGSGKSTYAAKQIEDAQAKGIRTEVCSADDYFVDEDGVYQFDATQLGAAHARSFKLFALAVTLPPDGDFLVVVDNTNVRTWEVAPYVQLARAYGFEVEIVRFTIDPALAASRNVHGVPVGAVLRMSKSVERLPAALGTEWIVPSWTCQPTALIAAEG